MNAEVKKELEAIKKNIEAECVSLDELMFLENNKEAVTP